MSISPITPSGPGNIPPQKKPDQKEPNLKQEAPREKRPPSEHASHLTQKFLAGSGHVSSVSGAEATPEQRKAQEAIDSIKDAKSYFQDPLFTDADITALLEKYQQALDDGTFNMEDFKSDLKNYWISHKLSTSSSADQEAAFSAAVGKVGITFSPEEKQGKEAILSFMGNDLFKDEDFQKMLKHYQQAFKDGSFKIENFKNDLMGYWASHDFSEAQETAFSKTIEKLGVKISPEEIKAKKAILELRKDKPNSVLTTLLDKYQKALKDGSFKMEDLQRDFKGYWLSNKLSPNEINLYKEPLALLGITISAQELKEKDVLFSLLSSRLFESDFIELLRKYQGAFKNGNFNVEDFKKDLTDYKNLPKVTEIQAAAIQDALNKLG